MTSPSALLAIQDGSGSTENQGQGYIQQLVPGDIAKFTLQSTAGITPSMRWSLVFESPDTPNLDGLAFSWSPNNSGVAPEFDVNLPPSGFTARYVTTIFDIQNALSQFTGEIIGIGGGGGGGGGGGSTITADFVQPAVGSSQTMVLVSTAGILAGDSITLVGGGRYVVVGTPADAQHLVALNLGTSGNATPGMTIAKGATLSLGNNAPLAAQVRLNGQTSALVGGVDTPQGMRPHHNFVSFQASTTDALNAARFESMLAASNSDALTCYLPPGTYGTNRPTFWTFGEIDVWGDATQNAVLLPKYSSGTDWSGPTLVIGPEQPDPIWVGPVGAGSMYGMPLGGVAGSAEVAYISLGSLDAMSLAGVNTFAVDMKFFYPAGGNSGVSGDLFFAGGGSVPNTATYALYAFIAGTDQLRVFITTSVTGFTSLLSTSGNKLNQNAWNDIRVSYDGAHVRIFINGVLDTTHAQTGTFTTDPFTRYFIGQSSDSMWLGGGDGPNGGGAALAGTAVGDVLISFCGTPVTGSSNYSPATRYVRDDTSTWTPPGSGPTNGSILVNFDVANRSTTICGHSNWVVAQCNITRTSQAPRIPGNTVWLSCGARTINYIGYNTLHNFGVQGSSIGIVASASPWLELDRMSGGGLSIGADLSLFSYFSKVYRGAYGAALSTSSTGLFAGDYWGLCVTAEGCHVEGIYTSGGNAALVGHGVFVNCYVDIVGYFGCAVVDSERVSTVVDGHFYNESNATGCLALMAVVNSAVCTVNGALIGTAGSVVPHHVGIYGGGCLAFNGVWFSDNLPLVPNFSFFHQPLNPVVVSGQTNGSPWLDTSNPGLLVFPGNRGVTTVASSADADVAVTDLQFYAGYTIELTGAHWSTGHNLVLPNAVKGDMKRVHNLEAHTATVTPGAVTVTSGSYATLYADGTNWVTA